MCGRLHRRFQICFLMSSKNTTPRMTDSIPHEIGNHAAYRGLGLVLIRFKLIKKTSKTYVLLSQ